MSLQFNDTTTFKGLVQQYEKEIGANQGDVSGNSTKLAYFTADCNLSLDRFTELALKSSGTWQYDDSNQTDYPEISTNLISGQRSYTFTTDEQGNLILEIYGVWLADSSGVFHKLSAVDSETEPNMEDFNDGQDKTGTPLRYNKTANGIFFDLIPDYSYSLGVKVQINREASYFTVSDATKKPGVPGIFHEYFALRPAYDYARRNNLAVLPRLEKEIIKMEGDELLNVVGTIQKYFSSRTKDERPKLGIVQQNNR